MEQHLEQQLQLESPFDKVYDILLSFSKICTGQTDELNKNLVGIDISASFKSLIMVLIIATVAEIYYCIIFLFYLVKEETLITIWNYSPGV